MKNSWSYLLLFFAVVPARAATVKIASPDRAKTYSDAEAVQHSLVWNSKTQALSAYVRFSNYLYANQDEPVEEESFVFALPGVTFDPQTKEFWAKAEHGERVVVATLRRQLLGHYVQPAVGTIVLILRHDGAATVVLTADSNQEPCSMCSHWVERESGVSLENFIRSWFGGAAK
ncbi:MAG: hypothetical protein ABSD58_07760 [Verrucomicrobiia bacterium]|jgi:hypothetical protein